MSSAEPFRHFDGDLESLGKSEGSQMYELAQQLASNELHRDEGYVVDLVDLVDDRDVGMLERRGSLGLLHETLPAEFVGDDLRREQLESHFTVELDVPSSIDDAHTAAADLFENRVMGQRPTNHGDVLSASDFMPDKLGKSATSVHASFQN